MTRSSVVEEVDVAALEGDVVLAVLAALDGAPSVPPFCSTFSCSLSLDLL